MVSKVLVIYGSVSSKEKSYSWELANRFIKYYLEKNIGDQIIYLDLNKEPMAQKTLTSDNFATFFNEKDSDSYINQLKQVNKVIMISSMNNFNVSAIVKNYLDHVLVANKTFSYKYVKKGDAIGLLPHLKVQVLVTQGAPYGWYLWGNHGEYLKKTWEFMGATTTEPILVAGTKIAPYNTMTPIKLIDEYDEKIKTVALNF